MPGVPFTCVSMAVVVVCSTVCALGPVNTAVMLTVGGVISGYCAMGNTLIEIMPTNTMTMEMTMAVTGRFINTSAIMESSGYLLTGFFCSAVPVLMAIAEPS